MEADMEILEDILLIMLLNKNMKSRTGNTELFKSRDRFEFYNTGFNILQSQNPDLFYKSVRMNYEQFKVLLELINTSLTKISHRKPINSEQRLYITLYFLAHGCSLHTLSMKFRIGYETARSIVIDTCDVLWRELHEFYVSSPNEEEWRQIATKFYETTKVPNCIGALDGKHIRIKKANNFGSQLFNYKKFHSIVLMAACDANYTFTMVDVGAYGSQSDGGVFRNSIFGRKLLNGELEIPADTNLPGTAQPFPHFFVADAAFPLSRNILKPFAKVDNSRKENYNRKISTARVRIEIAFGILSAKWRILHTTINFNIENTKKVVLATTVLHNFLRFNSAASHLPLNINTTKNDNLTSVDRLDLNTSNASTQTALNCTNILCDNFANES